MAGEYFVLLLIFVLSYRFFSDSHSFFTYFGKNIVSFRKANTNTFFNISDGLFLDENRRHRQQPILRLENHPLGSGGLDAHIILADSQWRG